MELISVPTMLELKTADGSVHPTVRLLGYKSPCDGGGGIFSWYPKSIENDDSGTIIAPDRAVPGRWKRIFDGALSVRYFGAQGDWNEELQSGTDDYEALQYAAAAMTARKGGALIFPPGVYRINRYRITAGTNQNAWLDITFSNCDGLHISGYGAKIDVMGNFHRPVVKNTNGKSYSISVQPFVFWGCSNVTIEGFELDGNVDRMTRDQVVDNDGTVVTADTVIEPGGHGIEFGGGCKNYSLNNLHIHHFSGDGLYLGLSTPASGHGAGPADENACVCNVKSLFNSRNSVSIISLRGGYFSSCEFSETGQSAGSYGYHPDGVGLDIEPQFTTNPPLPTGDFTFIGCKCVNNAGAGLSTMAGESRFQDCLFWGTKYFSIITVQPTRKPAPNLVFQDCTIYGECLTRQMSPVGTTLPLFLHCHFEDRGFPRTGLVYRLRACINSAPATAKLEGCFIVANETESFFLQANNVVSNSTIVHKNDRVKDNGFQCESSNCLFDNVHFKEDMQVPPATGWYLNVRQATVVNRVRVDGPYVRWQFAPALLPQNISAGVYP